MATPVLMPLMGMTMEEGIVSKWLVEAGATVTKGQEILEFETDKINGHGRGAGGRRARRPDRTTGRRRAGARRAGLHPGTRRGATRGRGPAPTAAPEPAAAPAPAAPMPAPAAPSPAASTRASPCAGGCGRSGGGCRRWTHQVFATSPAHCPRARRSHCRPRRQRARRTHHRARRASSRYGPGSCPGRRRGAIRCRGSRNPDAGNTSSDR